MRGRQVPPLGEQRREQRRAGPRRDDGVRAVALEFREEGYRIEVRDGVDVRRGKANPVPPIEPCGAERAAIPLVRAEDGRGAPASMLSIHPGRNVSHFRHPQGTQDAAVRSGAPPGTNSEQTGTLLMTDAIAGLRAQNCRTALADELDSARRRTLALLEPLSDDELLAAALAADVAARLGPRAHRPLRGAVAAPARSAGAEPIDPESTTSTTLSSTPGSSAPSCRCSARTSRGATSRTSGERVARRAGDGRARRRPTRCSTDGFVYGMVLQHEHQHDETMLATHPAARGAVPGARRRRTPAGRRPRPPPRCWSRAARSMLGTSDRPVGLRQRAAGARGRAARRSASTPRRSRTRRYPAFIEAGGYDDARLWTAGGLGVALRGGLEHPLFWQRARATGLDAAPLRPSRGAAARRARAARLLVRGRRLRALGGQAAADRGRVGEGRLLGPATRPARFPWGDAADDAAPTSARSRFGPTPVGAYRRRAQPRAASHQLIGDVWEWTSSDFHGLPGLPAPSLPRSTPRSSSATSTRCCAAARGRPPARGPRHLPQLGLPDPATDLRRLPVRDGMHD